MSKATDEAFLRGFQAAQVECQDWLRAIDSDVCLEMSWKYRKLLSVINDSLDLHNALVQTAEGYALWEKICEIVNE